MNDNMLHVNMLGEFSLSYNGTTINDQMNRSKKIWSLLEYLITFRDKETSQNELIELLWPNENGTTNPANTLKTLLYRVRMVLDELKYADGKELIVYRRGAYAWNNDLPMIVDADEFQKFARKSEDDSLGTDDKLVCLTEAVKLYKGDFLPKSAMEDWVLPINAYYHTLYTKIVDEACILLTQTGRWDEISEICRKAIDIDPYDESVHYNLIVALVNTNRQQAALNHYQYVTDLFYKKFGVNPSEELTALYKKIVKTNQDMEFDLSVIKVSLKETEKLKGAFYCEYEFFKNIYRLEARAAERSGQVVFIGLLTVTAPTGAKPEQKLLNKAMDGLAAAIQSSLRKGDVYARYSVAQYLVMLPNTNMENAEMALNRVGKYFKAENPNLKVALHTKVQTVDPVL